jgi:formylglycine-generating enzyme required for sulfatase activity
MKLATVPSGFVPLPGGKGLPRYWHEESKTAWRLYEGGAVTLGMTEGEKQQFLSRTSSEVPRESLEELLPRLKIRRDNLLPFLIMESPISWESVEDLIGVPDDLNARPIADSPPHTVGYFSREETNAILKKWGWSFPTENQWEVVCRGSTHDQLFFFGDDTDDEQLLERYVLLDPERWQPNPFGLFGLFAGEWCRDRWEEVPGLTPAECDILAVRGGASLYWPWQGVGEWLWCVSAMRLPSSEICEWLALRPVLEVP